MATQPKQKHSIYETGHGKNVANLDKLIAVLISFGTKYAPSNPLITIAALQTLYANCVIIIDQFVSDLVPYILSVDARQDAYELMNSLATRTLSILKSSGATQREIDDAKSVVKKLRSQKKKTIAQSPANTTPLIPAGELGLTPDAGNETATKLKRSVSQLSFDGRVEHFKELVKLLSAISIYNPNEAELTIAALNTYTSSLASLNHNVNISGSQIQKTRRDRNVALYDPKNGLVECTHLVKAYVRGVFGYASPEWNNIVSIEFKFIK